MRRLTPPNATPARFSATTVIACVALLVSGCAIGLMLGRWTSGPTTAEHSLPETQAQPQDLKPILEDIRRALERPPQAAREQHESISPSASAREAVVPTPEVFERLTVAVERLSGLLEKGGSNIAGGRAATESWKGPGYASLEDMWQRIDVLHGTDLKDMTGPVDKELLANHLLWTREDLFDRYGAPSTVYPGESWISLAYSRVAKGEEPAIVQFVTREGLVTQVGIDR
jgi:hypothetical protein